VVCSKLTSVAKSVYKPPVPGGSHTEPFTATLFKDPGASDELDALALSISFMNTYANVSFEVCMGSFFFFFGKQEPRADFLTFAHRSYAWQITCVA
jgi:hypothetical protein